MSVVVVSPLAGDQQAVATVNLENFTTKLGSRLYKVCVVRYTTLLAQKSLFVYLCCYNSYLSDFRASRAALSPLATSVASSATLAQNELKCLEYRWSTIN